MKKVYVVIHIFDTDGGYGDAIPNTEIIGVFSTKEKAEEIVNEFSNPHVYDEPYAELHCGKLIVEEFIIDELDEKMISVTYSEMFGNANIIVIKK